MVSGWMFTINGEAESSMLLVMLPDFRAAESKALAETGGGVVHSYAALPEAMEKAFALDQGEVFEFLSVPGAPVDAIRIEGTTIRRGGPSDTPAARGERSLH